MSDASTTSSGTPVDPAWSGVHRGPLTEGEWVRLTDTKGRRHNICLEAGKRFFSNKGHLDHDELIGRDEGFSVTSSAGGEYLVFRPLLSEFVVSMPRGAAVVYPKDAAQIVAMADVFPGARVVEAGVGFGRADLLAAARGGSTRAGLVLRAPPGLRRRRRAQRRPVLRRPTPGLGAHGRRPGRGDGRGGRHRRPGGARHARPVGVRRPRRARRWLPAGSSAPTSRPRPSSARPSRPSGRTAGSPSRSRGRPWCATGTSRASPYAPGTR